MDKYGMELILDLHECNTDRFKKKYLDQFFSELVKISDMTPIGRPYYWKAPKGEPHLEGYSGVLFIMTSEIIIHTLDLTGDIYINFFSCKDFDVNEVLQYIVNHFESKFYHYTVMWRGHHRLPENRYKEIEVRISSPEEMRYNTWGDYYIQNDKLIFQVTRMKNKFYTALTLLHEMIECFLIVMKGKLNISDVDNFDFEFERDVKRNEKYSEPGEDPKCPYRKEHKLADRITKIICKNVGIKFKNYLESE